ncbi:MAG: hypothetical protein AUK55_16005 [Syntrophobacteraceae bacterium CG2_30_61_12]|nr:MAG: hypothetical protein AUK55_16005 [Syntrophobacteraceae bacterium CG2_30_61_12]PIU32939.1 MAG: hypothetical protein COT06_00050 [Syntrophobacteraceae bacterium CG07_land_8_20_14_0_80_61_8]
MCNRFHCQADKDIATNMENSHPTLDQGTNVRSITDQLGDFQCQSGAETQYLRKCPVGALVAAPTEERTIGGGRLVLAGASPLAPRRLPRQGLSDY